MSGERRKPGRKGRDLTAEDKALWKQFSENVLPLEGEPYTDRDLDLPGMINLGDEAIAIFAEVGWTWGGVWQSADYMHFSEPGN